MTDVGKNYEAFRAHLGRLHLCGLGWGICDRILDEVEAPTLGAFGAACERLADLVADTRPADAAKLYHFSCATNWDHLPRLAPWRTTLLRLAAGVGEGPSWQRFAESELRLAPTPPGCRVLVAHGTHDPVMPVEASRMLAGDHPDRVSLLELDDGHVFLHHVDDVIRRSAGWLTEADPALIPSL